VLEPSEKEGNETWKNIKRQSKKQGVRGEKWVEKGRFGRGVAKATSILERKA